MTPNLKILGAAFVAALVLMAATASVAMAQNGMLTSTGPVTLRAVQTGVANANSYTAFGAVSRCPESTGVGHKYNTTPHELIPSGSSTATLTPSNIKPCVTTASGLEFPSTVDMNGCDGVYEIETTVGSDSYGTRERLVCPEGKHVTATVFGSAAKHTANEPFCMTTITENGVGYTGLVATDTTNGYIDVVGTLQGIISHRTSPTGSILCPTETANNVVIHVDGTGEGTDVFGQHTPISLSHN